MKLVRCLARGVVAASAVLMLAACSGAGSTVCNEPIQVTKPLPSVTPTLSSPASGATGVSSGPLDVVIGSAVDSSALYLKDGAMNFTPSTNFRQANPPSNDVKVATFAQLKSQTTYEVYAMVRSDLPTSYNPCGINSNAIPGPSAQLIGTFTTR